MKTLSQDHQTDIGEKIRKRKEKEREGDDAFGLRDEIANVLNI